MRTKIKNGCLQLELSPDERSAPPAQTVHHNGETCFPYWSKVFYFIRLKASTMRWVWLRWPPFLGVEAVGRVRLLNTQRIWILIRNENTNTCSEGLGDPNPLVGNIIIINVKVNLVPLRCVSSDARGQDWNKLSVKHDGSSLAKLQLHTAVSPHLQREQACIC